MIRAGGRTVYFAADTLLIRELFQIPARFPHIDLALLPTNGLRLRPILNRKVVMDATDAAQLTAILKPDVAVPRARPAPRPLAVVPSDVLEAGDGSCASTLAGRVATDSSPTLRPLLHLPCRGA